MNVGTWSVVLAEGPADAGASHRLQPARQEVEAVAVAVAAAGAGTAQSDGARRLVLSAVLHGFCLDDPWRHAFLRSRWMGA